MLHPSRFVTVWSALQAQVAAGRLPGFAAAVRHRGQVEVHTGGCLALDSGAPVRADSLFRLASLSKPYAGVLTLSLVEDGLLDLDDEVGRWLPELAAPRVLARPGAELADTVPADRPITVRHLLAGTPGFGGLWDDSPLDRAVYAAGIGPGPLPPELTAEEYLARLGELPLAAQPGTTWLYHLSAEVLSVLLARVAGRPLHELLQDRVTGPLGVTDTGFSAADPARLGAAYLPAGERLQLLDPADGRASRSPVFEGLAGGLVATAPDVLAFLTALADGGGPVLTPASVQQLTTDQLTAGQRADPAGVLGPARSWGMQVGLDLTARRSGAGAVRWGWDGGTGTSGWVDPERDLVAVLLTNRGLSGPHDDFLDRFWCDLHRCV